MKLCVAALDTDLPYEEAIEFLDHIEGAAEKMPRLLDELETVMDAAPSQHESASRDR